MDCYILGLNGVQDKRTQKYAVLEKKVISEQNEKNEAISIIEACKSMLESLQKDIDR